MNAVLLQSILFMSSSHMNTMPRVHKMHYPKSRRKNNQFKNNSPLFSSKQLRRFHRIKQPGFDIQRLNK
jgi:hypothetical protein